MNSENFAACYKSSLDALVVRVDVIATSQLSLRGVLRRIGGVILSCLSVCAVYSTGCRVTMLNVEDIIVRPDQQVELNAYLERRSSLFTVDRIPGIDIDFIADDRIFATTKTDANGRATVTIDSGTGVWDYHARATVDGREFTSPGRVFVWPAGKPVIVVDVDETILDSRYVDMVVRIEDPSPPIEHSREAVRRLSEHFGIVYFSTRPRLFRNMTLKWLREHDYPVAPTYHTDKLAAVFRQREERTEGLDRLQKAGINIVAGIGDKGADEGAFVAHKIPCIIVRRGYWKSSDETVVVKDWSTIADLLIQRFGPATRTVGNVDASEIDSVGNREGT